MSIQIAVDITVELCGALHLLVPLSWIQLNKLMSTENICSCFRIRLPVRNKLTWFVYHAMYASSVCVIWHDLYKYRGCNRRKNNVIVLHYTKHVATTIDNIFAFYMTSYLASKSFCRCKYCFVGFVCKFEHHTVISEKALETVIVKRYVKCLSGLILTKQHSAHPMTLLLNYSIYYNSKRHWRKAAASNWMI